MPNSMQTLVKNVNFDLRFVEWATCFVGLFFSDDSYFLALYGWLLVSSGFMLAYVFEKPNFGLEVTLIALYFFLMNDALWELPTTSSTSYLIPAVVAVLMFIDLIFLIIKRNQ